jgi:hypothetical protein
MENIENQLAEFKKLLDGFYEVRPNSVYEPTYLELCEYPWNRREEICSRLFAFFFDSRNPHGFGTLFFNSLFDAYREKYPVKVENFDKKNIQYTRSVCAETEIYTEKGNRIDLLLTTDCLKVCIENKIDAPADNDFKDYYDYVKNESKCFDLLPVCILFALCEKVEYENVKLTSDFRTIYYKEFLEKLKQNLGDYLTQCNSKYLPILTDFILFLDRRGGFMSNFSKKERVFFQENDAEISRLIARRSEFLDEKRKEQCNRIADIKKLLDSDGSIGWWVCEKKDLGYHFEKGNKNYEIGVEAEFSSLVEDKINIFISIWELENQKERIKLYSRELKDAFGDLNGYYTKGKWTAIVKKIDAYDDDKIVKEKILEVRNKLEDVVKKVKNPKEKIEST